MASGHPDRIASIPAESARLVLEKTGLTIDDIDVVEINEAFAAVPLVATLVMAGRDEAKAEAIRAKTNVNGGSIAIGHPTGATGARLIMTMIYELRRRHAAGGRSRLSRSRHNLRRHRRGRGVRGPSRGVATALRPDYAPEGGEHPGEFPYTRGISAEPAPWIMGQYAGFGTAAETNGRFRALLDAGVTGFSVALDLPTQMGIDSDDPRAAGEVGKVGVAIDSLADIEILMDGIPLERISQVRTTANSIGYIWAAMFIALAEQRGLDPNEFGMFIQNDVLKEYVARGTQIFPAEPSLAPVGGRARVRGAARAQLGAARRSPGTTSAKRAPTPPRRSRSRSQTRSLTSMPPSPAASRSTPSRRRSSPSCRRTSRS